MRQQGMDASSEPMDSDIQHDTARDASQAFPRLDGCKALVIGLGRFGGGVGVTRWLLGQGAQLCVTDLASRESLHASLQAIANLNVRTCLGGHDDALLDWADLAVVNPAVVKGRSPFFQEIVKRRLPWTTEMNLFCNRCPARVIGVTGTFGKSTTSAMLAAVLESAVATDGGVAGETSILDAARSGDLVIDKPLASIESSLDIAKPFGAIHAGQRVVLGGNIGRSLLDELPRLRAEDIVVLEMSNAQLEDLPRIDWRPALSVITNLQVNHLDRYDGSLESYIKAKLNIIGDGPVFVGPVIAEAETWLEEASKSARASGRVVDLPATAMSPADGEINLRIPGAHNQANARCVLAVCRALGLDGRVMRAALATFPGLPHRLEFVREWRGVRFLNDSKATNPQATMQALQSVESPLVAIVGAQEKNHDLADCADLLARRCAAVISIGESGPRFAEAVRAAEVLEGDRASLVACPDVVAAVREISAMNPPSGTTVLFSPGGPSFDQYANYEKRGEDFKIAVAGLSA